MFQFRLKIKNPVNNEHSFQPSLKPTTIQQPQPTTDLNKIKQRLTIPANTYFSTYKTSITTNMLGRLHEGHVQGCRSCGR
jgi:hypothetical protein